MIPHRPAFGFRAICSQMQRCFRKNSGGRVGKECFLDSSHCCCCLLLSRFSRVRLCVTPLTAAHQAPLSLGLSRQEHWSGLPFPSPMHERKSESEVAQSCPTLSNPMDCSLPGSSIHGIFQARVLEWVASDSSHTGSYILKWGLEVKAVSISTCHFKWDLNFHHNDMNN